MIHAEVKQTVQERPGGDDDLRCRDAFTAFERDADGGAVLHHDPGDDALPDLKAVLGLERSPHAFAIALAVGLAARGAHRGSLAQVQAPKLYAGLVGGLGHLAAERVDLAHEVPLGQPADGRIAAHLADGVPLPGDAQHAPPSRAAASAASQPACPAPTTIMSYFADIAEVYTPPNTYLSTWRYSYTSKVSPG